MPVAKAVTVPGLDSLTTTFLTDALRAAGVKLRGGRSDSTSKVRVAVKLPDVPAAEMLRGLTIEIVAE